MSDAAGPADPPPCDELQALSAMARPTKPNVKGRRENRDISETKERVMGTSKRGAQ